MPPPATARAFARFHLPALAWAVATAVLLTVPGEAVAPSEPGLEIFEDPVHGVLAAVQALLAGRSLARLEDRRRATDRQPPGAVAALAATLALAWALLLEGVQELVPGRGFEWSDLLFAFLGAAAAALWMRRRTMDSVGREG